MALEKFGRKRVCEECNTKFYDFNKKVSLFCPNCKKEFIVGENIIFESNERVNKNYNNLQEASKNVDVNDTSEIQDDVLNDGEDGENTISLEDIDENEANN